jgi:hypothetical protein
MDEDGMMLCAHDDLGFYSSDTDWRDLVDGWQTTHHQLPHHSDIWPIITFTYDDHIPGITIGPLMREGLTS